MLVGRVGYPTSAPLACLQASRIGSHLPRQDAHRRWDRRGPVVNQFQVSVDMFPPCTNTNVVMCHVPLPSIVVVNHPQLVSRRPSTDGYIAALRSGRSDGHRTCDDHPDRHC